MMKKVSTILLIAFITVLSFSTCKSEGKTDKKEVSTDKKTETNAPFMVAKANNDIKFTAYKTTEKVGVAGWFKKVNVVSGGTGNSVKEAINNTKFSIPVSSLFTKDTSRDMKIKKYFFGMMENTELLSGTLMIKDETNGVAEIKMNGYTREVPFTYTISDRTFSMSGTMDINEWKGAAALASLNKVCEVLHTGADGVSKTWSEVALNITSTF